MTLESPHRLKDTLLDLHDALGDREIAVCRELTKLHEEVFRGKVSEAINHFTQPRGEFTLVLQGQADSDPNLELDDSLLIEQLTALKSEGMHARDAVKAVVEDTGVSRRKVYDLWIGLHDK